MAFDEEAARIDAMTDPLQAYEAATTLVNEQIAFRSLAAGVRARAAARVRTSGDLSIAKLGQRLGVSKARAARMLHRAEQEGTGP